MTCNKFKVGDRVCHIHNIYSIGVVKEALQSERYNVDFGVYGLHDYPSEYLELAEPAPVYEEGWTLNDGKVEVPEDAKTLKADDGDDVVAFKRRIEPKVGYVNIFNYSGALGNGTVHSSRKAADEASRVSTKRVACVKVTEGQYDD